MKEGGRCVFGLKETELAASEDEVRRCGTDWCRNSPSYPKELNVHFSLAFSPRSQRPNECVLLFYSFTPLCHCATHTHTHRPCFPRIHTTTCHQIFQRLSDESRERRLNESVCVTVEERIQPRAGGTWNFCTKLILYFLYLHSSAQVHARFSSSRWERGT